MGIWPIIGAPKNGVCWRLLGCLLLLSTGLCMFVENAWRVLDACCLFLITFWMFATWLLLVPGGFFMAGALTPFDRVQVAVMPTGSHGRDMGDAVI